MKAFRIAAIQSSSTKGAIAENIAHHLVLLNVAKSHGADVVLFPELSLTGYEPTIASEVAIHPDDEVLRPLQEASNRSDVTILAGCPLRSEQDKPYIGMLIVRPGQETCVYRKRFVHSSEDRFFTASQDSVVITASGMPIGVAICADINHPEHAAGAARLGAKVYAAGVADPPEDMAKVELSLSSYAKRHAMLAVMANYASETGGFRTGGKSAAWDETGALLAQAPSEGECILLARQTMEGWEANVVAL